MNQFLEFRIPAQFLSGPMFQAIDSLTRKLQAGRDEIEEVPSLTRYTEMHDNSKAVGTGALVPLMNKPRNWPRPNA